MCFSPPVLYVGVRDEFSNNVCACLSDAVGTVSLFMSGPQSGLNLPLHSNFNWRRNSF